MTAVFYLITDLDVGGAERALLELVRRLDRRRFQPTVCSLGPAGVLASEFAALDVPVYHLGMGRLWQLPRALKLLQLLDQQEYDIVHTFLFHANVLGRVAARIKGVPVVVSGIRVAEPRRWHLLLERWTAPLADRMVAVSEGVRRHMVERARIPPGKVLTIPNGVDLERFRRPRGRFRRSQGIPADRLLVTTVGRLDAQKGLKYLLQAVPDVLLQHPKALFALVGDGPRREKLEEVCRRLEIGPSVLFLGFRSDVPDILADSDVFVLPSLWEGLANAMLEAMAAGVPVLVTDVEGARDVVTDGETGLLVQPGDPLALATGLNKLLGDRKLRTALGHAGRLHVSKEFRWEKVVESTVSLYDRVLSEKGVRQP